LQSKQSLVQTVLQATFHISAEQAEPGAKRMNKESDKQSVIFGVGGFV
jgi:hypothetical protein